MNFVEFIERAISVPFVDGGRGWDGWDCWGLVRMAYAELRGVELPMHSDDHSGVRDFRRLAELMEAERQLESWTAVDEKDAQPLDVALLRLRNRPMHVGVAIGQGRFIHAEEDAGTAIERWNRPPWRGVGIDRVEGFYAYRPPGG